MAGVNDVAHPTTAELDAGWSGAGAAPARRGTVEMIVCRPGVDERRVLDEGRLVVGGGLVGDNYLARGNRRTADGRADPEAQLNLMSSRAIDLVSGGDRGRWSLAGDQLFVDFDLSLENAPPGTRLSIGTAVIEVSAKPHNGCAKFAERFGTDAARWVNQRRDERRRGINAKVVEGGTVRTGDPIEQLDAPANDAP